MSAVPVLNLLKTLLILAGMAFAAFYMLQRQGPVKSVRFAKFFPSFSSSSSVDVTEVDPIPLDEDYSDQLRASADLDWSIVYRGGAAQRSRVAAAISEAASLYSVDENLIRSVIMAESMFDARATSSRGAKGLMQLMPATAQELGVKDIYDVRENILGGTLYLSAMIREFKGSLSLALAAYHAGPQTVKNSGNLIPYQSKSYVALVASYYELFGIDRSSYRNGIYHINNAG